MKARAQNLGFGDYVKEAFGRKLRLPLLGAMPVNLMALGTFAVLGLANPGFWLLGAAGELAYLFATAGSERFQKLVQGERLLDAQRVWSDGVGRAVGQLTPEGRNRYRELVAQCRRVLGVSETLDVHSLVGVRDLRAQNLNQLLSIFLRLLTSREIIQENVRNVDSKKLAGEIADLEKRVSETDPEGALARSLRGTVEIQRRRLENLGRASEDLEVIDAELDRIEQQVDLIREESAVSGKPEALSMRLDAVTTTMSETNRWIDDHAEFFDSLGDGETSSRLPDLPEVPRALEVE